MSTTTASTTERQTHPHAWLILALILCAEVMDLLDSTIVNVAAPNIARDLHSGTTTLQWVTGGYSLTFAVFLIAGARLGDRYGRRTLFLVGAWSFVACSTLCAVAPDAPLLITGRLLQGGAAALLIPQGMGLIYAAFRPEELGKAFAVFGPVVSIAAVVGPVLGGVLVDANLFGSGWRLVFIINLPIGIIAALGAARLFPDSRADTAPRLDLVGTLLVGVGAALITYPLIQGRDAGWPAWTYAMMAGGVAALALLALWTPLRLRRQREPLVEPSIFTHRGFVGGVIVTLVFFGGTFGVGLTITLFLQLGLGFTAVHAGLTAAPYAVGSVIGALAGGAMLVPRLGRTTLQVGSAAQALALILVLIVLSQTGTDVTSWDLAGPLLLWGIGIGLVFAPLFDFVLSSLSEGEVGSGSGVLNALQQLGSAMGVAIIGTVYFSTISDHAGSEGRPGYVTGLERCAQIGIGVAVVVALLTYLLPRKAREEEDTPPVELANATSSNL